MRLRFVVLIYGLFAMVYSCHAQNGPTQPTVLLTYTQSASSGITKNCAYRGLQTSAGACNGSYTLPGTCYPADTKFTDTTPLPGTNYCYAVTAQNAAGIESGYSLPTTANVPANPSAPSNLQAPTITENLEGPLPGFRTAPVVAVLADRPTVAVPMDRPTALVLWTRGPNPPSGLKETLDRPHQ